MELFDTHAHLDDSRYESDREEMLRRAQTAGVKTLVNVGYDRASSQRSVELAESYPFIYAAVGIHPHDAASADAQTWEALRQLAAHPKVVALGEMGLDFYRDLSPRPVQEEVFRYQIRLAKELNLPIIVHDRDAHGEVVRILEEEKAGETGGILHCFSGSWEMAKQVIKMGFYISLAGPVTFAKAPKLQEVGARVPLERLLIETDSPYLTPEPYRGRRNEPAYVEQVARKLASLRNMTPEELAAATAANARRVFRLE